MKLILGDCLEKLKDLPDNSVDSVVTDPPYGLSFMNKHWDYDVPKVEIWREVLRVLKPGGHLLSFGGTRTYHRMVVAIEDAGFEIRDQVQWIYGSGFPKSHNLPGGIGTALKPANEPIVLARKPLDGTVASNVEKYGTGGLNIDGTRIEPSPSARGNVNDSKRGGGMFGHGEFIGNWDESKGRWPANVIFDEDAAQVLDAMSGPCRVGGVGRLKADDFNPGSSHETAGGRIVGNHRNDKGSGASRFFYVAKASKRERGEGNAHPTVKPIKLMQYLIKLITPPGGIVLDPFMGSGSTGCAAQSLGFDFIGIERDENYFEIAKRRIDFHSIMPIDADAESDDDRQIELPIDSDDEASA